MKIKTILIWILAFVITGSSAVYQKITGPTYPIKKSININNSQIEYKLQRSHAGTGGQIISIPIPEESTKGFIEWKRYKTNDSYTKVEMTNTGSDLVAELPHQPPAGKLEYKITLVDGINEYILNDGKSVVIRFRGAVPDVVLIIHIITIFGAMLLSTRTGIEALRKDRDLKKLTLLTIGFLIVGGFIFGPIVQKYAFGAFWTGFPFGHDLTDNKTLIALIGWLIALVAVIKQKKEKLWVLFASVLMLAIFLIPHSMMGSELDYNKLDKQKNNVENLENTQSKTNR